MYICMYIYNPYMADARNCLPTKREVYVGLQSEGSEAGIGGMLVQSMYGIRDAAPQWATCTQSL